MKIWLINPYGPIPGESWRDYCFTTMGKFLTANGHEVVWWTSSFSHHFKAQRQLVNNEVRLAQGFTIRLVRCPSYQKNISFGRIWRDLVFAIKMFCIGSRDNKPDLIIYAESPLNFGMASFWLAKYLKCPVVYHVFDLWPELMINVFPKQLRKIAQLLFAPVFIIRKKIYKNLSGVTGLAKPYLNAVLNEAEVLRGRPHALIYNGIDIGNFRRNLVRGKARGFKNYSKSDSELWVVFAGTLGPSYDIVTIIKAADICRSLRSPIRFFIAGDGPLKTELLNKVDDYFLVYLGSLSQEELVLLYAECDVGLSAYSETSNVEMPDKFYDYTAAGLAIVNSLRGEVATYIVDRNLGFQYQPGSELDLTSKLNILHENRELLEISKKNSWMIAEEFSIENQYPKLLTLIEKLFI